MIQQHTVWTKLSAFRLLFAVNLGAVVGFPLLLFVGRYGAVNGLDLVLVAATICAWILMLFIPVSLVAGAIWGGLARDSTLRSSPYRLAHFALLFTCCISVIALPWIAEVLDGVADRWIGP